MSSSPDPARLGPASRVLGSDTAVRVVDARSREFRTGDWTRLADGAALGDLVTEHLLGGLAQKASAAAQAQGYAQGWAEGRHAAQAQAQVHALEVEAERVLEDQRREAEHLAALSALHAAAQQFAQATSEVCDHVQAQVVELAVELTETLVGHELAVAAFPGLDAVRRGLALMPDQIATRVRLAPAEAARAIETGVVAALAPVATVVADPTLVLGDAIVEADTAAVDVRVSAAMARVREVLAP